MAAPDTPTKRRILIVDDEPFVCDAVKMMLEFEGYLVDAASHGEQALSQIEPGKYHVVITDFAMPGMQGDELAVAIKARVPRQPVIMLSAHGAMLIATGRQLPGVDCIMEKPFRLETLREAIAKVTESPVSGHGKLSCRSEIQKPDGPPTLR